MALLSLTKTFVFTICLDFHDLSTEDKYENSLVWKLMKWLDTVRVRTRVQAKILQRELTKCVSYAWKLIMYRFMTRVTLAVIQTNPPKSVAYFLHIYVLLKEST